MKEISKKEAQMRADQISLFNAELKNLEDDDVLHLNQEQKISISAYHKKILTDYSNIFDIDISSKERQLTIGMRIASLFGALALSIGIFFLFYHYWGLFSTFQQIVILLTTPVIALVATVIVAQREKTLYFTKLLSLITLASFILNISVLGQIYNITPSDKAFIAWGALSFLLAYAYGIRLLLVAGIICITGLLAARVGVWSGIYWIHFGERPENFLPVAVLLFTLPFFIRHQRYQEFESIYRVFGLLVFFIPVLILSYWGYISYLHLDSDVIEVLYQIIGFAGSVGLIAIGIRYSLNDIVNTASIFFVIFLYTKIYDWWWEWMPKYLFFLLVGLIAVLILFIFKRLRYVTKSSFEHTGK